MQKLRAWIGLGGLLFLLARCSIQPQIGYEPRGITSREKNLRRLQEQITDTIRAYNLESAFIGIYIEEVQSQRVVYALNAHKLFMPASNMKIITSASALNLLKPEFRFTTTLSLDGEVLNDTLSGDLIVKGEGDPTIKTVSLNDTNSNFFKAAIAALKARNISHIRGQLKGDVRAIESQWGESWCWDDLWYSYSAKPSALILDDNCFTIKIIPGDTCRGRARIELPPYIDYQIDNHLITIDSTAQAYYDFKREPGSKVITIWGAIPQRKDTLRLSCTVEEPAFYFLRYFQQILADSGITVEGYALDTSESLTHSQYQTLVEYQSPPLSEIVVTLNKVSHNLIAEQLLRTMGRVQYQKGTAQAGIQAVKNWLGEIGVDTNLVLMVDGSGLARTNLLTPIGIAQVLRTMRFSPYWEEFRNSLPIGGVDGTLKSRLRNSNAIGSVWAKTGYIGRVRALSGYVLAKNGKEYLFSIIVNHYPISTSVINALQDSIVTLLYNFEG